MIIIRPITKEDTEAFIEIAFTAGIGMTSMPKNPEKLKNRVNRSEKSFSKEVTSPQDETYLFVLEDLQTGVIGGTCGIVAKTGRKSPLSFYRVKKQEQHKGLDSSVKTVPALHIVHHKNYGSEICSLYLSSDFRHSGLGRLLSLSRFLFIAAFPDRFDAMTFAEMRGHLENGTSPFWEGIGRHFIDTEFEHLMHLRDEGMIDLSEILPLHPIYIELLPQNVQQSIGKTHDETKPALEMLLQEGFNLSDELDICDGGPKIEIETKNIRSVKASVVDKVVEITDEALLSPLFIISNNRLDFRACLSPLKTLPSGGIAIPQETAKALKLTIGDSIRYVSPYSKAKP